MTEVRVLRHIPGSSSQKSEPGGLEHGFAARVHFQLAIDVLGVRARGGVGHVQELRHLHQREALRDESQHLDLAGRQRNVFVARGYRHTGGGLVAGVDSHAAGARGLLQPAQDMAGDLRAQRRMAGAQIRDRRDPFLGGAVLDEVAGCAGADRGDDAFLVVEYGRDQNVRVGPQPPRRPDGVDAAAVGQAEIDDEDVEVDRPDRTQSVAQVRAHCHDPELRIGDNDAGDRCLPVRLILQNKQAHGDRPLRDVCSVIISSKGCASPAKTGQFEPGAPIVRKRCECRVLAGQNMQADSATMVNMST